MRFLINIYKPNRDLDSYKKLDSRQKQRIKQLEVELETSMKKFNHKGLTDRLYSPFSAQSNGSKKSNYSAPNRNLNNNNKISPASSKNSFNSRNSSNSVLLILFNILGSFSTEQKLRGFTWVNTGLKSVLKEALSNAASCLISLG